MTSKCKKKKRKVQYIVQTLQNSLSPVKKKKKKKKKKCHLENTASIKVGEIWWKY